MSPEQTNNAVVFGFTGPMAAGKTKATQHLADAMRESLAPCVVFSTSDYIGECLKAKGIEPSRENRIKLGKELEDRDPAEIVSAMCGMIERYMNDNPNKEIIPLIDSIRSREQAAEWKRRFPGFELVYIDTDWDIRFKRYNSREEEQGRPAISEEEFKHLHEGLDAALEKIKPTLSRMEVIPNNGAPIPFLCRVTAWYIDRIATILGPRV